MTRELTTYLKGIAVFLMVMEHSFGFPQWYIESVSYPYLRPYADIIDLFAAFAVVAVFAFLTGWTYYLHADKSFRYSLKKILSFLLDYWVILFIFAGLAYYVCDYKFTAADLIKEMFSADRKIMIFSWYVILYLQVMLFLPWFHRKVSGYQLKRTICFVLAVLVLIKLFAVLLHFCGLKHTFLYSAFNRIFFRYLPIVLCGYVSAKYNLLEKMSEYFNNWGIGKKYLLLSCFVIFYIFFNKIGTIDTGLFIVPIYISLLISSKIDYSKVYNKLVIVLGKHSMNIWFLHCLFFAEATREVFQVYAFYLGSLPKAVVGALTFVWWALLQDCGFALSVVWFCFCKVCGLCQNRHSANLA